MIHLKTVAEFCRSFDNLQGWNDIVGQKANAPVLSPVPLPAFWICCILFCVLGLIIVISCLVLHSLHLSSFAPEILPKC